MRPKVLSGGANAKTCPNSCCWPQTAPMKGAENFPQTKFKKQKIGAIFLGIQAKHFV